jgi:hypothetical protein
MTAKTLKQYKETITPGMLMTVLDHWIHRHQNTTRVVEKVQGNGYFYRQPGDPERYWSPHPKTSELEFDGKVAKIKDGARPEVHWTLQLGVDTETLQLEKLQALGFKDVADYQAHQHVMQASRDLAVKQIATVVTISTNADGTSKTEPVLNDRYAETIIGNRAHEYDGIEIQGVRNLYEEGDERGTACEVENENPQFYSTYVHVKSGGTECVGDHAYLLLARAYAQELAGKYDWKIYDCTLLAGEVVGEPA